MSVFYLFLETQRQKTTQILLIDKKRRVLLDVWGENRTVRSIQTITVLAQPISHVRSAVVLVNNSVLCDIIDAGEHRDAICAGAVFAVEQAELVVRQLLLFRHDVLGELQKRILISPQQLSDRDLNEWLDL